MKQVILFCGLFLLFGNALAHGDGFLGIPSDFWDAELGLRHGIREVDRTVGAIFATNEFVTTEALDGSTSTFEWREGELDGNRVTLILDQVQDGEVTATIQYHFVYLDASFALLESIGIENFETGERFESDEFRDKLQFVDLIRQITD